MIIQCQSCSKKFIVKDSDIPAEGRDVQCGHCSVTWHQMPLAASIKAKSNVVESLSIDNIKASDGKMYKFLGSQWAELLPSGKTGLFAKKVIGKELDRLTGRKLKDVVGKKQKKIKKEVDPSSISRNDQSRSSDGYKSKHGLGFFGYIFLFIVIVLSVTGILKTFENDLLNYFPETKYVFELLDVQLEHIYETIKNITVIIKDLINSY